MHEKILIVEDEKKLSRFIELELQHEGYRTTTAFTGKEALTYALEENFDLILLDIMIPEPDGITVCKKILSITQVPIIFLTAKAQTSEKVEGLDSGAVDYVTKPFEIEELLARIRANLRNSFIEKGEILRYDDLEINKRTHAVMRGGQPIELRKKEFQLLSFFMENAEKVISRDELLNNVWGLEFCQGSNVIDVHIRHLREKIDTESSRKLIHTIRGFGYVFKTNL